MIAKVLAAVAVLAGNAHAVRFTLFSADTGQPVPSPGGGYRCQLVR